MADDSWRQRLRGAIEQSGKSLRAVSLSAGCAASYVHGMLEAGKEPTLDKLLAVCDAVPVSPIYVILGVDALPDDVAILKALHENPTKRQGILALLGEPQAG